MRSLLSLKFLKSWTAALIAIGMALTLFSLIDLSGKTSPFADLNEKIVDNIAATSTLPTDARVQNLEHIRVTQENALAGSPAEPFAWARLAWLRLATGSDRADAFTALQLSDLISPDSPRQLPERALMWRQFRAVENDDQQAYQAVLWQKAFRLQPDQTWQTATRNGLTDEAGNAIKAGDAEQYEEWKARGIKTP